MCGINTAPIKRELSRLVTEDKGEWRRRWDELVAQGFNQGRSLWEADHIVPVCMGGGETGLDNYQTLCVPCHKRVTAELRKSRKKA